MKYKVGMPQGPALASWIPLGSVFGSAYIVQVKKYQAGTDPLRRQMCTNSEIDMLDYCVQDDFGARSVTWVGREESGRDEIAT